MERDYGKKNGEKHAGEKKGEGEYLSRGRRSAPETDCACVVHFSTINYMVINDLSRKKQQHTR